VIDIYCLGCKMSRGSNPASPTKFLIAYRTKASLKRFLESNWSPDWPDVNK
jgi:hypothetical protein